MATEVRRMVSMALVTLVASGACGADWVADELARPVLNAYLGYSAWTAAYRAVDEADAAADEAWRRVGSADEFRARGKRLQAAMLDSFGGFPERTPLNARTVGTLKRDGYVIEKVIFESRPGMFVTAFLYLPDSPACKPPYPATVFVCGHSRNGKNSLNYRRAGVLGAKAGIAVFAFDPIAQGERVQRPEDANVSQVLIHSHFGTWASLLGRGYAAFETWDAMRAMDYLETRADLLHDGFGCMGNSGGGTQTALVVALEGRVKAAAPESYLSTLRAQNAYRGLPDAEQISFAQLARGFNHAGYVLMGGAPVLICAQRDDFVPFPGTLETWRTVRAAAAGAGLGDRYAFFDACGVHGYSEATRVASFVWLRKWLCGDERAVLDRDALVRIDEAFDEKASEAGEDVPVSPTGHVFDLPGFRSVYACLADEAADLAAARKGLGPSERAAAARKLADIREETCGARAEISSSTAPDGTSVRRETFACRGGFSIPAIEFVPGTVSGAPVLVAGDGVKTSHVERVKALLAKGRPVAVVDLMGIGETGKSKFNLLRNPNEDEEIAKMLYLVGSSLVGRRAEELIALARSLKERFKVAPEMVACGRIAVAAAHARACAPEAFAAVEYVEAPPSWTESVTKAIPVNYAEAVNGALRAYDWTELR